METPKMETPETAVDLETQARAYLKAFESRDIDQCMAFYDDNASLSFVQSDYKGKDQIQEWHKARFAADLRVLRVEKLTVEGNTVVLAAVVTSKRLKAWKLNTVRGTVTTLFEGSKIKDLKFGMRLV
jgi:ketosteroid isomerase-like protein